MTIKRELSLLGEINQKLKDLLCRVASPFVGDTLSNPPVAEPGTNDPKVLINRTLAIMWIWDGSDWVEINFGNLKFDTFGITINGNGSVITTGVKGSLQVPYDGIIIGYTLLETSDPPIASDLVIDIWKDSYANYPPDVTDTIVITGKPTLSSSEKNTQLAPDWDTSFLAGDIFTFNVDSVNLAVKASLFILTLRA